MSGILQRMAARLTGRGVGAASRPLVLFVIESPRDGASGAGAGRWNPALHLTFGSLASPLMDRAFLRRYFTALARPESIVSEEEYPAFDVQVLNLARRAGGLSRKEFIRQHLAGVGRQPLIVGASATSEDLALVREIAAAAKALCPQALRIVGGPHASIDPVGTLETSDFQVACLGEGVETLCELAVTLARTPGLVEFAAIPGIACKDAEGSVCCTAPRVPVLALDEYPFPSLSLPLFWPELAGADSDSAAKAALIEEAQVNGGVCVLTGMGCPRNCAYCAQKRIRLGRVRCRSARGIYDEVLYLHRLGFRHLGFLDEDFTLDRERVLELTRLIRDDELQVVYNIGTHPEGLDEELIKAMVDTGLFYVQMGVESGDLEVLRPIGRRVDLAHLARVTQYANELGVGVQWYLLVGLPGQTWQSVLRTARLFAETRPAPWGRMSRQTAMEFMVAVPYPGTRLAEECSVRVVNAPAPEYLPKRTPDYQFGPDGELTGTGYTETDAMGADEILEAWVCLRNFCNQLLQGVADPEAPNHRDLIASAAFFYYVLQRRAIRELVVAAQEPFSPGVRRTSLAAVRARDDRAEDSLPRLSQDGIEMPGVMGEFLAGIRFLNGCDIMSALCVRQRVLWMKVTALAWIAMARSAGSVRFGDVIAAAAWFEARLKQVPEAELDRCLEAVPAEGDRLPEPSAALAVRVANDRVSVAGIDFELDRARGELIVSGAAADTPGR